MVLKRTCSLWKLDVLAISLTPSSIASKPSACQSRQRVKSDPKRQKPPFAHRMYSFFAEACRLGSVKLFFTEPCSRRDRFVFFFCCCCLHLLCHFRFAPIAPRDNSFRFQAYTQHPLAFRIDAFPYNGPGTSNGARPGDRDRVLHAFACRMSASRRKKGRKALTFLVQRLLDDQTVEGLSEEAGGRLSGRK